MIKMRRGGEMMTLKSSGFQWWVTEACFIKSLIFFRVKNLLTERKKSKKKTLLCFWYVF